MSSYDFTYKIILLGDDSAGKQYLTENYCYNIFNPSERLTIGVDFHVKSIELSGIRVKMQIWDVGREERFRFLLPTYCLGANAAILLYDVTNNESLYHLADYITLIRQKAGTVPIMLIGSTLHLENKKREISWEQGRLLAENYQLSAFAEISSQDEQNVNLTFQTLVSIMFQDRSEEKVPVVFISKEFIINDYLKLRLENKKTNIYVGGSLFRQCKYLLLDLPIDKIRECDKIESIDEAAEMLDASMEQERASKYGISPEVEFWGHCSNIQAWYENDYASCLLHRNLAFPLLKALVRVGDPLANRVFKEEIALRLESGYPAVVLYLTNQGYLNYLNSEELDTVFESAKFLENLPNWLFKNEIPLWLFEKLKEKITNLYCPYCGIQLKESLTQKCSKKGSIKCEYCYTTLVRII
jgi:small GTP-binding protein